MSIVWTRAACMSIAICAGAPFARAAVILGPSTVEAIASGNTNSDLEQNIAGAGDYSQTASATTGGAGSWSGFWNWTGQQWVWTWVFTQSAATGQNTASYSLTVATGDGLSITGSASAIQTDDFPAGSASVTLTSAFGVTDSAELASLSATLDGPGSSISLTDTTTSQTLFSSTSTFLPTSISLPADDQFLLQYNTTSTFPGSDTFNFAAVPEPAAAATFLCGATRFVGRRRSARIWGGK